MAASKSKCNTKQKGVLHGERLQTVILQPEEFRTLTRSHVLAWRADLEKQALSGATNRRKLAALASLFDYPCDCNAVLHNPVNGMKRPAVDTLEGKTPALGDA